MRLTRYFRYAIADQDHPVVVLNPAAHRRGHANACSDPRDDTSIDAQVPKNCVEGCARCESAKAFLDYQMLPVPRLQFIDDLCSPGALHTMRLVAAPWFDANAPIRKGRVGIVGL